MPTVKFRIAHISDLHLAERPGEAGLSERSESWRVACAFFPGLIKGNYRPWMTSYHPIYLAALTRALRGDSYFNSKPYDGYIFSGDLATTGLAEDMAVAAAYLHGRPMHHIAVKQRLKLPNAKTVLVPGNHDRYCGNKLWPTSAEFERGTHFGAEWSIDNPTHSPVRSTVSHSIILKDGAQLGVVCGDFSYTSENSPRFSIGYLGGGCVEDHIVDEMTKRTAFLRDAGVPSIWVVHHAPISKGTKLLLKLKNAHKLGDAALDAGVRYILCGHTHRASGFHSAKTRRSTTDRVRVLCAGSATSFDMGDHSYFELVFSVASGTASASVMLAGFRSMVATNLGLRESSGQYSRKVEFRPMGSGMLAP
jgi:3',5'-cyclic AMP phosphodiesterase CpdA